MALPLPNPAAPRSVHHSANNVSNTSSTHTSYPPPSRTVKHPTPPLCPRQWVLPQRPCVTRVCWSWIVETDCELRVLGPPAFTHAVPALLEVYEEAMRPPPEQLSGRALVMSSHALYPGFQSVVAFEAYTPIGFAYAFHGAPGQWWHDMVTKALRSRGKQRQARRYLSDPWEIAEVHVRPEAQNRGIGR